jgi:Domain of unknown function (DUF4328)
MGRAGRPHPAQPVTTAPLALRAEREYRPLASCAVWARRVLVVAVVVDVIAVAAGISEVRLYQQAADGNASQADLVADDSRQAIVGLAQFGVLIVGAVFFLRWFHRAYANLRALGAATQYGAGWAIGFWFIPILNLFRPKQMADEIWSGSGDDGEPAPGVVTWWWVAFILSGIVGQLAFRVNWNAEAISDFRSASWLYLAADVFSVAAGVLALTVITRVTARQEAASRRAAYPAGCR